MSLPMSNKVMGRIKRNASFAYAGSRRSYTSDDPVPLEHLELLPVRDPDEFWRSLSGYLDPSITTEQRRRIKKALAKLVASGPQAPENKARNVQLQWLQREMWPESYTKTEDLCFGV